MNFEDLNNVSEVEMRQWDLVQQIMGWEKFIKIASVLSLMDNHPELDSELVEIMRKMVDFINGKVGIEAIIKDWQE